MGVRRIRHRLKRWVRHRAVLALLVFALLAVAWIVARWLAASAGGFPADPP
jgi:hypothetical protein